MPRLPRVTAREIVAALEKAGFSLARQSGSHMIYKNPAGKRVTVPFHAAQVLHPKVLKTSSATPTSASKSFKSCCNFICFDTRLNWDSIWLAVTKCKFEDVDWGMVGLGGLEPPTSPLSGARSSHLSYRPAYRVANDSSTLSYQPFPGNSLALPEFPGSAGSPLTFLAPAR